MEKSLPAIPAKRYFTIGEVSELCAVKPYVLRYWEQEFTQLRPVKRRGNRRYYQHHEVLLIRRIRELLYDQGFTISGARNRLAEGGHAQLAANHNAHPAEVDGLEDAGVDIDPTIQAAATTEPALPVPEVVEVDFEQLRVELLSIRKLLTD
jgi:DNA-binding transcriptional MerR regulator